MEKRLDQWKILAGQEIKMEILAQGSISKLWKENEIKSFFKRNFLIIDYIVCIFKSFGLLKSMKNISYN